MFGAEIWKNIRIFIWKSSFLVVKFSVYLNRHVFVMTFTLRILDSRRCKVHALKEDSDQTVWNAQTDLSLHWAHMSAGRFLKVRFIWFQHGLLYDWLQKPLLSLKNLPIWIVIFFLLSFSNIVWFSLLLFFVFHQTAKFFLPVSNTMWLPVNRRHEKNSPTVSAEA